MSARLSIPFLLLSLSLPGCADSANGGPAAAGARDSAGITIVENTEPAWTAGEAWTVSAEPVLAMGGAGDDRDHEFFQIAGLARLTDGTIVVANGGTHELRYYGTDGSLRRSVGRKGGGPGEFQILSSAVILPGDSVLVFDPMNRRSSLFDPAGRHVRDVAAAEPGSVVPSAVVGRLRDGSYVARSPIMRIGPAMLERKPGPTRDSVWVMHLDSAGVPFDSVGPFPGLRSDVVMVEIGGRSLPLPIPIPFSPMVHVATGPDRVYVGVSDTYEIQAYSLDRRLATVIRRRHEPQRVTETEAAEARSQFSQGVEDQSNPFVTQYQEAFARIALPETRPAYRDMLVDRDGNLWVAESRAPGDEGRRSWSVFGPDGRWLGDVAMPPGLRVSEIGTDYVLGRSRDDLEVERVLLYALIKPQR